MFMPRTSRWILLVNTEITIKLQRRFTPHYLQILYDLFHSHPAEAQTPRNAFTDRVTIALHIYSETSNMRFLIKKTDIKINLGSLF